MIVQYSCNTGFGGEGTEKPLGIYIHVPFCDGKCPYCDFYSMRADEGKYDEYLRALTVRLGAAAQRYRRRVDTLYIGGGTPSLLGGERISEIVRRCRALFGLEDAEITVECNPRSSDGGLFERMAEAGVNRVSLGMQSADSAELAALGRRHGAEDARRTVEAARAAGITNISIDLMIGTPGQTEGTLARSADFCLSLGVPHISAYMLKIEEGTAFYRDGTAALCPDADATAGLYELLCGRLETAGLLRYEISNFARPGFESRHNLKYWRCEEYLGIGPAAHSFVGGKRMYYPRSLDGFLSGENGGEPLFDCEGGDFEEYAMLRLRLREGLDLDEMRRLYPGASLPEKQLSLLESGGFVEIKGGRVSLTTKGALVSNEVIGRLVLD